METSLSETSAGLVSYMEQKTAANAARRYQWSLP